jgi:hypothetical protein
MLTNGLTSDPYLVTYKVVRKAGWRRGFDA